MSSFLSLSNSLVFSIVPDIAPAAPPVIARERALVFVLPRPTDRIVKEALEMARKLWS